MSDPLISKEDMTIFTIASIRKFILAAGVGVPTVFLQQGDEREAPEQDEVQILTTITYPQRGTAGELYGMVNIQALVKTKIVPTDVYYHTRVKARMAGILDSTMPLYRIGGPDTIRFDKSQWGILRRLPTDHMKITVSSIDVPDASVVESYFEIQTC